MAIWCKLMTHAVACAFCFALESAGNNNPARMPMIAITTRSSISVKAALDENLANQPRLASDRRSFRITLGLNPSEHLILHLVKRNFRNFALNPFTIRLSPERHQH